MELSDIKKTVIETILKIDHKRQLSVLPNILEDHLNFEGVYYIEYLSSSDCKLWIHKDYFDKQVKKHGFYGIKTIVENLTFLLIKVTSLLRRLEQAYFRNTVRYGVDHHFMVGWGDWTEDIRHLAELLGMPFANLTAM